MDFDFLEGWRNFWISNFAVKYFEFQVLSYGIANVSNDEIKLIFWNIMFLNDILDI